MSPDEMKSLCEGDFSSTRAKKVTKQGKNLEVNHDCVVQLKILFWLQHNKTVIQVEFLKNKS